MGTVYQIRQWKARLEYKKTQVRLFLYLDNVSGHEYASPHLMWAQAGIVALESSGLESAHPRK